MFASLAFGAGAMNWRMPLPPAGGFWFYTLASLPCGLDWSIWFWAAAGFFLDSAYSLYVPSSWTFLLFSFVATGLELALSKCSVLPFFSV